TTGQGASRQGSRSHRPDKEGPAGSWSRGRGSGCFARHAAGPYASRRTVGAGASAPAAVAAAPAARRGLEAQVRGPSGQVLGGGAGDGGGAAAYAGHARAPSGRA